MDIKVGDKVRIISADSFDEYYGYYNGQEHIVHAIDESLIHSIIIKTDGIVHPFSPIQLEVIK